MKGYDSEKFNKCLSSKNVLRELGLKPSPAYHQSPWELSAAIKYNSSLLSRVITN